MFVARLNLNESETIRIGEAEGKSSLQEKLNGRLEWRENTDSIPS